MSAGLIAAVPGVMVAVVGALFARRKMTAESEQIQVRTAIELTAAIREQMTSMSADLANHTTRIAALEQRLMREQTTSSWLRRRVRQLVTLIDERGWKVPPPDTPEPVAPWPEGP